MSSVEVSGPSASTSGARWVGATRTAATRVGRWLLRVVVPTALTCAALVYLVPPEGSGMRGIVADLAARRPVPFAMALFLALTATTHHWTDRIAATSTPSPSRGRALFAAAALAGTAMGLAVALRATVARPYRIHGSSMLPTLETGDLVAARPWTGLATPRRGDLLVFSSLAIRPAGSAPGGDDVVKRVIGLPGDRIEMSGSTPIINGWPVPSCDAGEYLSLPPGVGDAPVRGRLRVEFLEGEAYLAIHAFGPPFAGPYVVRPAEVFVLGDDRGASFDSRSLRGGQGGGVAVGEVAAQIRWFLVGTRKSGDADFARFLRPIDALARELHDDGRRSPGLREGVARCLAARPASAHPPAPTL